MSDTWTIIRHRLITLPEAVALISLTILFSFFTFSSPYFLSGISISNILTFGSITGIVAIGVGLLMISGEFDLSVGSTFAAVSYVLALSLNAGVPVMSAIFFALMFGTLLGLVNGLIVTRTRIPSFIATLGTMLAYRGLVRAIGGGDFASYRGEPIPLFKYLNGELTSLNALFQPAANFRLSTVWFVLIVIIVSLVLMRTRFGNWVFATGGAPAAALAQGVHVTRVKMINFILCGFLAGAAGVLQFAHRLSVDPLRGEGMELVAVAACVIGGIRLSGGFGTIFGAMAGILLLNMLDQGLVLLQIPIQIFQATAGLIIIISVIINTYLGKSE
ncbi:MAG: ABC transporter permease [Anaerolineaceae bacterium]|nr:ABC transporter permease [Anaerolineaceae bacterium]